MKQRCVVDLNQSWTFDLSSQHIQSLQNGLCLSWVANKNNDVQTYLHQCNDEETQRWYIDGTLNNKIVMIRTAGPAGKCLAIDESTDDIVLEQKCYFKRNQRFHLKEMHSKHFK